MLIAEPAQELLAWVERTNKGKRRSYTEMVWNTRLAFLFVAQLVALCPVAEAGIIGETVNVSAYYPNTSSVFSNPGNVVVSGAIEYPAGSYPTYNPSWQVDVGDNSITITNTSGGFPYASATFNGFIMDLLSGPTLLTASADPLSDFFPTSLAIVGNQLQINFAGVNGQNNQGWFSTINFTTSNDAISPVPEPASLAIWGGLGLVGIFTARRRRLKQAASV